MFKGIPVWRRNYIINLYKMIKLNYFSIWFGWALFIYVSLQSFYREKKLIIILYCCTLCPTHTAQFITNMLFI